MLTYLSLLTRPVTLLTLAANLSNFRVGLSEYLAVGKEWTGVSVFYLPNISPTMEYNRLCVSVVQFALLMLSTLALASSARHFLASSDWKLCL